MHTVKKTQIDQYAIVFFFLSVNYGFDLEFTIYFIEQNINAC